jgi:undecaprenyl-phosphate 4-deoxy-4-formamido-L-arabinose transferase
LDLSIVIPVYNSESILPELLTQIDKSIDFIEEFELILVNDNSPDNSWNIISELSEKYSFLKAINLRKNSGQHNAIMAGLNLAKGNVIIMMDDDLQHSPEYLNKLYNKIISGTDVCYTAFPEKKHKGWKILGSKFNDLVASILLDKPKGLYMSSFKAVSKEIKDEIITYDGPYVYLDGLILNATNNIAVLEVEHKERFDGDGNYNLIRSVSLWSKMATSFSVLPLRVATFIGLTISILSFLVGIYLVLLKLMTNSAPEGWTSLMVVVLFLGGIQLLSIGIIGEYVGRSYLKINRKKQYIIKEIIGE